MAQQLMNLTSIYEDAGSIPSWWKKRKKKKSFSQVLPEALGQGQEARTRKPDGMWPSAKSIPWEGSFSLTPLEEIWSVSLISGLS